MWKMRRFLTAIDWMLHLLDSNPEAFKALFAIPVPTGRVSPHVLAAFWRLYAAIPESELVDFVPTVSVVSQFTRESLSCSVSG